MSSEAQVKVQAKTPVTPGPARAAQPPQAVLTRQVTRPNIATQLQSASHLGHSLSDIRVDRSASPDIQPVSEVRQENRTGLPDKLKAGVENMSGISLEDVKVHYNSPKPAEFQALAYTRGTEIHVAPGQEQHLPHEAWHVVQQKQSRVVGTGQQKGVALNESRSLEHEAEVMGAKAIQHGNANPTAIAPLQVLRPMISAPAIQMFKYIRKRNGSIMRVDDNYQLKGKEKWSTEEAYLNATRVVGGSDAETTRDEVREAREAREAEARKQELAERQAREVAARKQERAARRARVTPANMPQSHEGKQVKYPGVVRRDNSARADLVYRGMSVNNVRNMQRGKPAVFTAQAPTGRASAIQHIVDDSPASPYLSFETGGLAISAGKYAAKPVHADTNKPMGVEVKERGFLKQEKSYTEKSREDFPDAKRIGYVGGIPPTAGSERLDVSNQAKATAAFRTPGQPLTTRQQKAVDLATADKEVLVKPGERGIPPAQVPFVAKVQEVPEAYYRKHLTRQTSRKALGYYKPHGENPVYSKIQIPERAENDQYKFHIPDDLRRADDDSEDEMSDVESIDLDDYESETDD